MRKLLIILNSMLKYGSSWNHPAPSPSPIPIDFQDSCYWVLLSGVGFVFQTIIPDSEEAPSGFFKGCPQRPSFGGFGLKGAKTWRQRNPATPDFVMGLLESADLIGESLPHSPRWLAQGISHGKQKVANLDSHQRQKPRQVPRPGCFGWSGGGIGPQVALGKGNQPSSSKSGHDLIDLVQRIIGGPLM